MEKTKISDMTNCGLKKLACLGIAFMMLFSVLVFSGCNDEVSIWFEVSSYAWFEVDDGIMIPSLTSGLIHSREELERRADEAKNKQRDNNFITEPIHAHVGTHRGQMG